MTPVQLMAMRRNVFRIPRTIVFVIICRKTKKQTLCGSQSAPLSTDAYSVVQCCPFGSCALGFHSHCTDASPTVHLLSCYVRKHTRTQLYKCMPTHTHAPSNKSYMPLSVTGKEKEGERKTQRGREKQPGTICGLANTLYLPGKGKHVKFTEW